MDRFIVKLDGYTTVPYWRLKSNMDRFIDQQQAKSQTANKV